MGKPKPPPAPDPVAVAQAQSQSNIATAQEQQRLNMVNTAGPQGTVNYEADPNAPGGYRQVTSLSPAEQAIYDSQHQAETGALATANTQLGRVNDALATPLGTDGLPALQGGFQGGQVQTSMGPQGQIQTGFNPGQGLQYGFNPGQGLQYGFNPGQQVQGQVGPQDLTGAYQAAANASYGQAASRLDPQFAQAENALRTKLANQGLSQNDTAYQTALQNFGQQKNDAYNQANFSSQGMGLNAENAIFGQALNQGQFANSAAGQQYSENQGQAAFHNQTSGQDFSQNQGLAAFHNQTSGQDFSQNQGLAAFGNQAQQQGFDQSATAMQLANAAQNQGFNQGQANAQLSDTARQQGLQERAYIQNQPINQFTGLLSLGQVGMPQGINYTPSQVAPTDVIGANALATQAQQAAYNAQVQQSSGLMNGLFSLGGAAIMHSDWRLKTDARLIRRRKDGVGVWAFRYLSDQPGVVRVGVMAQELRRVRPDLVVHRADGFMAVDYSGLDLEAA